MKLFTIYTKQGEYIFSSSSLTTQGLWINNDTILVLDENNNMQEAITKCFNASKKDVPHPTEWNSLMKPLLKYAKVKSWKNFVENRKCIVVEEVEGVCNVIPTKNCGAKGGFNHKNSESIKVDAKNIIELQKAIKKAIELSE